MILSGRLEGLTRGALRLLPVSDYVKTRLWATGIGHPIGRMGDRPCYRGIELALRAIAHPERQRLIFPGEQNSILEFGIASGESFKRLLHFRDVWKRQLRITRPIVTLGFDTFSGIPAPRQGDEGVPNAEGDFTAVNVEALRGFLTKKQFRDFDLIPGRFAESLPPMLPLLKEKPPIFISLDCDYYSSTMDVFQALIPSGIVPHGCVFYFDDAAINFWSDRTGELRAIQEVNGGAFGKQFTLWNTRSTSKLGKCATTGNSGASWISAPLANRPELDHSLAGHVKSI